MNIKKITRRLKKLDKSYLNKVNYYSKYKKLPINEKVILFEPQQGRTISGNIFYLLKETVLNKIYESYTKHVVLQENAMNTAKLILEKHNIKNVEIVEYKSAQYYTLLATAKYLITDTSFDPFYIKKEGQIILNTWHGTPLKCLGKDMKTGYHAIGNVQKNFLISDYLLYPNDFTKEHMIEGYMLENICNAKVVLAGYPRNSILLDKEQEKNVRKELELEGKEIIIYMPTWREITKENTREDNRTRMEKILEEMNSMLSENQIIYVNLHPLERNGIDFSNYENIKAFPEEYETYEFLNIADCLITDYSSVFFDFATTKKKIILYAYDKEIYFNNRGIYFSYDELPFTEVHNAEELKNAINSPKSYDESEFIEKFCKYDEKDVSKKICEKVILNRENELIIEDIKNNGKNNVLVFAGNLAKNGLTSALKNIFSTIDLTKNNYIVTFSSKDVKRNPEQILDLPKEVSYIATNAGMNMTIGQKIRRELYFQQILSEKSFEKHLASAYKDEIKRVYGDIKIDKAIQFTGYSAEKILLFAEFECDKYIYVHSDMLQEIKVRKNQNRKVLKHAYNKYDKVVLVNEDLIEATVKISGRKDNICIAENIINYKRIEEMAKLPITFDEKTELSVSEDEFFNIINSNSKKFINIGRFSVEKGHRRLIEAFNRFWKENKDSYLIIIGGAGKEYETIKNYIEIIEAKNNIVLIKYTSNPYAILKKCDYFVLSSFYEGFGLVIAEADIVGKKVISTDIVGPRNFILSNGGTLVPNNVDGLYEGFKKLSREEVNVLNVDYEAYNKTRLEQIEKIWY